MTMQDLLTLNAMVNEAVASFKKHHTTYTEEEVDTFSYVLARMYWRLFKRSHLNGKNFCKLVSNSVRLALSK